VNKERKKNMVKFGRDCEVIKRLTKGWHVFKVYEVNEKTSKAGNLYWEVKVTAEEGGNVCDILMFSGKGASKTLAFFTALGLADGVNFPKKDFKPNDILGKRLQICVVMGDDDFLKFPFSSNGYKAIEEIGGTQTEEEELPW
jgi:hypothetical protein